MYKRIIKILCILLITAAQVRAGEYAADFLRIGIGARALAMGGAFTALANDATAFYWNPAGLGSVRKIVIHVDHVPMFEGLAQFNTINFSMPVNRNLSMGLSWIRHGEDDIPRYSALNGTRIDRMTNSANRSDGVPEGYFGNSENAFLFTLGRVDYFDLFFNYGVNQYKIPLEFCAGITGKYILHTLDNHSGSGQGIDAGLILRIVTPQYTRGQANSWIGVGVTAHDISRTSITWDTDSNHSDLVRTNWQAGLSASHLLRAVKTRATLSVDKEFGFYHDMRYGGELLFYNILAVRGGYYLNNFAAGAGFSFLRYSIDYAFVSHDLGNTHRMSGSFHF